MVKTKGARTISRNDREEIKALIRKCDAMRFTLDETLQYLESNGYDISQSTLYNIKDDMKKDMKKWLENLPKWELIQYITMTDQMIELQRRLWNDLEKTDDPKLKIKMSAELRNLAEKIADLVGSDKRLRNIYNAYKTRDRPFEEFGKDLEESLNEEKPDYYFAEAN